MIDPVLTIRLSIERRRLDIHRLVGRIEVDVADGCGLAGERGGDGDGAEEGRRDEVDVLPGIGEETHPWLC